MQKTKKVFGALDLCGVVIAAYQNAKLEKISNGPRFSKFPVAKGHKFKIHVPSHVNSIGLEEIVMEHFENNSVSITSFSNLSGEIVYEGSRYFVSLNVTNLDTKSVIDLLIRPL